MAMIGYMRPAIAMAAAAMVLGDPLGQPLMRPERAAIPVLDYDAGRNRRIDRRNKKLKARDGRQRARAETTRYGQHTPARPYTADQRLVQRMTNWQRSQWAKAGYPGLSRGNIDAAKVLPFAEMRRA